MINDETATSAGKALVGRRHNPDSTTRAAASQAAKVLRSKAKNIRNAGRKKSMRACRWCGEEFGAREMQIHIPKCPRRPR